MSTKEAEIFTACENGTFKFALTQAQKLIKKNPKSTFYQILYNYVLLQSGKEDEAIENCKTIAAATPNDTKSLELLNSIFTEVGMAQEAMQVYENAAKKYPSFEILTKWFHLGCETANYRVLQKSSMAIKGFSSRRLFNLWAAFTCYLAAVADDATALEKGLFPKLGLKIVDALRPMGNEQETFVLVKLLQLNGLNERVVEEILAFSKDDKLDLELQIILLETLDKLEDWEQLYKWSETVLVTYKLDDFDTWKFLVKSGLKLNKDVASILSLYDTRNSKLANVELQLQSGRDIHPALFEYLTKMGTKNCAFFDIKQYITHLDSKKLLEWLDSQEIPKGEKGLTWEVNTVKIRALLDKTLFTQSSFISDLVAKYNFYSPHLASKSKTDFSSSSELILLIAQSLLSQSFTPTTVLICLVMLESAVLKDEHEFHLRLWLIQLYTLINCHTQAQYHYKTLSIKNVQHDIMGQYLLSRVASLRPIAGLLDKPFAETYRSNDVETVYFVKVGFNKGVYNKLGGMLEFQKRLDKSALKKHISLQGVKIGRLLNDKNLTTEYKKTAFEEVEYDNRDLKIFWNFGIDEPIKQIENQVLENIPGAGYNEVIAVQEKLIAGEIESVPEFLDLSSLTEVEKWSFTTVATVKKFLSGDATANDVFKQYDTVPKVPHEVSWKTSHTILTLIDTCKAVHSIFGATKSKAKGSGDVREKNISLLNKIRDDTVMETKTAVVEQINRLRNDVGGSKTLKELGFTSAVDRVLDIVIKGNTDVFKTVSLL